MPRVEITSLTPMGTPASGGSASPLSARRSMAPACARARSGGKTSQAWVSSLSIFASSASTSAVAENCFCWRATRVDSTVRRFVSIALALDHLGNSEERCLAFARAGLGGVAERFFAREARPRLVFAEGGGVTRNGRRRRDVCGIHLIEHVDVVEHGVQVSDEARLLGGSELKVRQCSNVEDVVVFDSLLAFHGTTFT